MSTAANAVPGSPACPVCGALYYYARSERPDGSAFERLVCDHILSRHPTYDEVRKARARPAPSGDVYTKPRRDIDG